MALDKSHFDALVKIPVNGIELEGMLVVPRHAKGVVLFAHGSGSSRLSPRNTFVATLCTSRESLPCSWTCSPHRKTSLRESLRYRSADLAS